MHRAQLATIPCDPADTAAVVDGKQIERAIYNLLLNACQSARIWQHEPRVEARLKPQDSTIIIELQDNGPGVPENIRTSLFQPFVSEGKQKGSGLKGSDQNPEILRRAATKA